jgi:voltage-dependent anion channel protein 2
MVQQFSLLPFNLSKIEIFYVISAHNAGHDCCPVCADLLTKDYTYDHKLVISTTTQSGLAFTSNAVKRGDALLADISTSFRNKNITADVKVDTKSNIITTITVDEFAPGAKSIFSFTIPDQNSGKVELQYRQDYAAITGSIGLKPSPIVEATGVVGSDGFAVGGELAFDTASGNLTKYNAALNYIQPGFNGSLILADKGDTLKASYLHTVSPTSRTTVAAEIAHKISKNENTFTVGGLYELDILTTVKARLNNHGKVAALLQHEWRPKSLVTISGEVDTKALDKSAKLGLAIALKP